MNKLTLTLILFFSLITTAFAQSSEQRGLSEQDREKWLTEMRNAKHEYLVKELGLSKEQEEAFFPLYDEMDDQLMQIAMVVREMERKVNADPEASDQDIQNAAQAIFQQKSLEGELEMSYFEQFKKILTPRQLLRLKNAERKFTNNLFRHRDNMKSDERKRKRKQNDD